MMELEIMLITHTQETWIMFVEMNAWGYAGFNRGLDQAGGYV